MRSRISSLLPSLALVLPLLACQISSLPIQLPIQLPIKLPSIPGVSQTPAAPGGLIFEDDFSDHQTGWSRHAAPEGIMDYDAGGFRIMVKEAQVNFWSTPQKDLSDVRLEVDEGKLGGPDENRVGLICRFSGDNFYFFLITHDGYYGIGMFSGDPASGGRMDLIGQTEMQASPLINRGTNVNHLRADCSGSTLTLYVNGEQVAQVQDARLTHGDVGVLAGAFAEPGVDVIFDNFVALHP